MNSRHSYLLFHGAICKQLMCNISIIYFPIYNLFILLSSYLFNLFSKIKLSLPPDCKLQKVNSMYTGSWNMNRGTRQLSVIRVKQILQI